MDGYWHIIIQYYTQTIEKLYNRYDVHHLKPAKTFPLDENQM